MSDDAQFYADTMAWLERLRTRTEHERDFERTRITPGADPRAEWNPNDAALREIWRLDDTGRVLRYRPQSRRVYSRRVYIEITVVGLPVFDTLCDGEAIGHGETCRYVPFDVARWRDPKHRAALTARARAHAAISPGVFR